MSNEIDHVGVVVDDMEEVLQFLREVFGFSDVARESRPESGVDLAFVDCGGWTIELIEPQTPEVLAQRLGSDRRVKIEHVAVATSEFTSTLAALAGRGIAVEPRHGPYPHSRGRDCAFARPHGDAGMLWQLVSSS